MARTAKIIFCAALIMMCGFCAFAETNQLRVISLYPGHSDNIYALGGGELLAALSDHDDSDLLPELPRVSLRSGAERLLALKPDMVITRSFAQRINPELYEVLGRCGVKVISLDPPEWENFPDYLRNLAQALGLDSHRAEQKLSDIISSIRERVPNRKAPKVFLEATSRELHTCSAGSWADRLIALAGGLNIASGAKPLRDGSAIASFGLERVIESAQSIDIYIIQTGAMNSSTLRDFHARRWSKALGNAKVVEIPERYMSRPSLLGLEKGAEILLKTFWEEK